MKLPNCPVTGCCVVKGSNGFLCVDHLIRLVELVGEDEVNDYLEWLKEPHYPFAPRFEQMVGFLAALRDSERKEVASGTASPGTGCA